MLFHTPESKESYFLQSLKQVFSKDNRALVDGLHTLCFSYLLPWHCKDGTTENYRRRCSERGLLQRLVELLNDEDSKVIEYALLCVWSYGENGENRVELASHGIVPLVFKHTKSYLSEIQQSAMGALWGFLEYEDVQEQAIDQEVIIALMNAPSIVRRSGPSDERLISELLGCIFCCACNVKCRQKMIEQGIVDFIFWLPDPQDMACYFTCLSLAFLCTENPVNNPEEEEKVKNLIIKFLESKTPKDIATIEERDSYSWRTLMPFYTLTLSKISEVRQMGVFCLAHLAKREPNRKLFLSEGILENALCHCWDTHEPTKKLAIEMSEQFYPITPPSLLKMTRFVMRKDPILNTLAQEYEVKSSIDIYNKLWIQ